MKPNHWIMIGICFVIFGISFIGWIILNDPEPFLAFINELQKASDLDWIRFWLFMIWITLWGKK